ncbi:MAG: type transport system ATP-binding protein [Thermoleophilaceae bacterium]|nr:type transport system ATP-binding protein [Thermoleophilaceae bacterium]
MAGESIKVVQGPAAGTELQIDTELLIGRGEATTGPFEGDSQISRRHARITRSAAGRLVLEDLGSTNGTFLNGWQIPSPQVLSSGDQVQAGATVLAINTTQPTSAQRRSAILPGLPDYQALRPPRQESVLYVDGLRKSYGKREVLKGVDLEVQPGEILGLLGANGAGKTSMVSIIAGLRPASAGTVTVAGIDALAHPREARKHLGLAPQDLGIYPTLSVGRNLRFFGELAGLRGRQLDQRVREVGDALSLTELFDRRSAILSGGQKRRLHTGMAMIHGPKLLILDEPTVGADVRTRTEILDLVKRLAAEGRAVVYSTHYMPEIEELGASVAILLDGQIIARGSIADLIANHSSTAVELTFDGPPPALRYAGEVSTDGSIVRIKTNSPDRVAAQVVSDLGAQAQRLLAVEIIRPSLESVYLSLTSERYSKIQPVPAGYPPPPQYGGAGVAQGYGFGSLSEAFSGVDQR